MIKRTYRERGRLYFLLSTGLKIVQRVDVKPEPNISENPYDQKFWESLCHGCGDCCYYRWQEGDRVISTEVSCKHLDIENHKCTQYENRERIIEGCSRMTPNKMPSGLPEHCGYVQFLRSRE